MIRETTITCLVIKLCKNGDLLIKTRGRSRKLY